ncbi:Cytochrome P450 [Popillia japonica]|uniref:Cytochrome P450 n=1 Tax=Popillia japonica TaxID=7064 RepID=A0AAW1LWB9_POPJA
MVWLLVVLAIIFTGLLYLTTVKPKDYPPGPKWYPIKGSVDALRKYIVKCGSQHIAFAKLAQEYNTNILGLKLGEDFVVVVFTYDIIKHILRSEDFESRPDNFFIRLRSMGEKKGITCADGERWSSQRGFLVKHFRNLGFGKEEMQKMVQEELSDILLTLECNGLNVEVGKLFSPAVISILWNLTAGSRIKRNDRRLQNILDLLARRSKIFDMAGGRLNMYPWLRFIMPKKSGYKLMMEINREMKAFFMEVIKEHYANWNGKTRGDLIYEFITEMKKNTFNSYFTEDQLVMVCADILIAGAQTTSNTLDFAFLMMILHENIQCKVQEELDRVFQSDVPIAYSDRINTPYTEAVLMEVERFLHVVPIIGPRRVLTDVKLEQYIIPKNTTVLISTYSVHMDKEFWIDPEVFRPERFLNELNELVVPERFIPFGLGKRRCLGEALAKSCLFTFFAEIMRKFSVTCSPNETKPTGIPIGGMTLSPENYKAVFTKRH